MQIAGEAVSAHHCNYAIRLHDLPEFFPEGYCEEMGGDTTAREAVMDNDIEGLLSHTLNRGSASWRASTTCPGGYPAASIRDEDFLRLARLESEVRLCGLIHRRVNLHYSRRQVMLDERRSCYSGPESTG